MPTILVVDDDKTTRQTLKLILESQGFEIVEADDGDKVMDLLNSNDIQLLITDIVMPGQAGLETILGVKDSYPDLPIVAISGKGESSNTVQGGYLGVAKDLGADKTLEKPVNTPKLLQIVNELLNG